MRLIAYLAVALSLGSAKTPGFIDYRGVWIAVPAHSPSGGPSDSGRLILNVTQKGGQLTIVELRDDYRTERLVQRQCTVLVKGQRLPRVVDARRTSVLGCSAQREAWTLSMDGSELTVRPLLGTARRAKDRVVVFQRSVQRIE